MGLDAVASFVWCVDQFLLDWLVSPLSRLEKSQRVSDKSSHDVFALGGRCRAAVPRPGPGGAVCSFITR